MSRKPFFLCAIFFLLFSACAPLYHPVFPPNPNFIYSPKHHVNPEIHHIDFWVPNRPIVMIGPEGFVTENEVDQELEARLVTRSLDGGIVFDEQYSSHEASREVGPSALSYLLGVLDTSYIPEGRTIYYTQHNFYCKYWPFIYLDSIETRNYIDRIELKIEKSDGSAEDFVFHFDWYGQIKAIPAGFKDDYYKALLVQPWFFLNQQNLAWREDHSHKALFPDRKYLSGSIQARYDPVIATNQIVMRYKAKNYKLYLQASPKGPWQLDAIQRGSTNFNWQSEDFFGRVLSESWQDEDGTRYLYRYFYKNKEDVPADWIINPQSLLQH